MAVRRALCSSLPLCRAKPAVGFFLSNKKCGVCIGKQYHFSVAAVPTLCAVYRESKVYCIPGGVRR